ncbi:MAG: ABC-2 family transporter protein [Lachnospiraceae bacterium]|nr:ABC-2 family transporter protein [Lachnospiraceae bacterium]
MSSKKTSNKFIKNFKDKLNVYLYVYKIQIIRSMAYKFDVYGNIIMQTIIMIATAYFWKALFNSADSMGGVTVDTMLTYTVVSSMVSVLLTTNVEWRITESIKKGTIAIDMMRPVNIFKVFFAENLGAITALIFQNLLPIFIIGSLIIKVPVPNNLQDGLLFIISLILAFLINWYLAVIFGMWGFKVIEMSALIQVKKHLLRLLSGSIIPIWFFPNWLRGILECLPFMYIYQMPISIYVGQYTSDSLRKGLMVQLMWVVILFVTKNYLEKRVTKSVMIQGG